MRRDENTQNDTPFVSLVFSWLETEAGVLIYACRVRSIRAFVSSEVCVGDREPYSHTPSNIGNNRVFRSSSWHWIGILFLLQGSKDAENV